jgi:hypothetical protein
MAVTNWQRPAEFPASEKVENALLQVLAVNRAMESTLVDVIAAYTPWLASVIPASIGWLNVQSVLHFSPWQAWVYAIVVECLGLATVATSLKFWSWNQEHQKRAPFWLALVTAVFYLTIVLAVNALLDDGDWRVKLVKALASSLSVAGALIVAMRSQQAKLEKQAAQEQVNREQERLDIEQRRQDTNMLQIELAKIEAQKVTESSRLAAEEIRKEREAERNYRKELKLAEIAAKLEETRAKVSARVPESGESFGKVSERLENVPETFRKWSDWRQVPAEHQRRIASLNNRQVRDEYGCSEKTAGNWIRKAVKQFGSNQI